MSARAQQCLSSFPYIEDFEHNTGGWSVGGAAPDWAWGIPNKPAMLRAGNGAKCWIAGGLTGNHYNDNEASWLQSPCFDFTSLTLPYISFLINWDTEKGYDGAGVQYSVDNGATWQSAGAYGDLPAGCTPSNWYTDANISYAVQPAGWSGSSKNSAGNIAGWVKAFHSFPELAGKSNVRFRFVFGAGNIQNNYGGVGIDDIYIGETTANVGLSMSYVCIQETREAAFFTYHSDCIDFRSLQWNFDDPASGAANIINNDGGVHSFSGAGIFHVSLTGKDNNGNTVSDTQTIVIPDLKAVLTTPIVCHGGIGVMQILVINTDAPAHYYWLTDSTRTTASGTVKAEFQQVQVTTDGGCMNYIDTTLIEPAALYHETKITDADCSNLNGSATITESGGLAPYQYMWTPGVSTAASADHLSSGVYLVSVTDQSQCLDTVVVQVSKPATTLKNSAVVSGADCEIENGQILLHVFGGNPPYAYQWTPAVSTTDIADDIGMGVYSVVISDNSQCTDTAIFEITEQPIRLSLGNDTTICKGESINVGFASPSYNSYLWNDGSTLPFKEVNKEGDYSLTVTNACGGKISDTIHIFVGCSDLAFPSGFTPNGDGLNEDWGPVGGVSQVSSYQLLIYNRYGNLVFRSSSPFQKWKGDIKGIKLAGTYVFMSSYIYRGERKIKKGTLTLML